MGLGFTHNKGNTIIPIVFKVAQDSELGFTASGLGVCKAFWTGPRGVAHGCDFLGFP